MTGCQSYFFDPTIFTCRREKGMQQLRRRSRIMARVSWGLAVLRGSPVWVQRRLKHAVSSLVILAAFVLLPCMATAHPASPPHGSHTSGCQLHSAKGDIQHVIYLIFDNVHFLRDNPNVPSDLEQMPNL